MLTKSRLKQIFFPHVIVDFFLMVIFFYFVYHVIVGQRGLISYFVIQDEIQQHAKELQVLVEQRTLVEEKVRSLSAQDVDLDLLDELARKDLGLIKQTEKCFVIKKQ